MLKHAGSEVKEGQRPRNPKLLRPRLSPDDFPEATAQFFLYLFISVCWSLSFFNFVDYLVTLLSQHVSSALILDSLDANISSMELFHRNLRSSLIFVFLSMSQGPLDQQDLEFELEKQRLWDTTWYNWAMIITWTIPTPFESA